MPYAIESGDIAGAVVVVVKDGAGPDAARLRLCRRRQAHAGVARNDAVPHRLGVQADHLDRGHAAGRAGQARPRRRRQHLPRLQDSRLRRQADHAAQHHDAHGRLRGNRPAADQRQPGRHGSARRLREGRHARPRIFAPGEVPAYSNYATALAGYIVERVSGQSFDDYVEQHIFKPLGMQLLDLPPAAAGEPRSPSCRNGYGAGAAASPRSSSSSVPAPAGSQSASGADMAKFMIAHLNDGAGLMKPETARHDARFRAARRCRRCIGMALGFYRDDVNGHRGDRPRRRHRLHALQPRPVHRRRRRACSFR